LLLPHARRLLDESAEGRVLGAVIPAKDRMRNPMPRRSAAESPPHRTPVVPAAPAQYPVQLDCLVVPAVQLLEEIAIFFPGLPAVGTPTGAVAITPSLEVQSRIQRFKTLICGFEPRPCPTRVPEYCSALDFFLHGVDLWRSSLRASSPPSVTNTRKAAAGEADTKAASYLGSRSASILVNSTSAFQKVRLLFPSNDEACYLATVWRGYVCYRYLSQGEEALAEFNYVLANLSRGDDRRIPVYYHLAMIARQLGTPNATEL